jgi:sulfoquinovosidase
VTYDQYDGMQSAMVGLLNGGLAGFSFGHSDIGGYTSINETVPFTSKRVEYIRD